jgi:hypothetical protein
MRTDERLVSHVRIATGNSGCDGDHRLAVAADTITAVPVAKHTGLINVILRYNNLPILLIPKDMGILE